MSNCKICDCPLTRLLDAKGKPEKRTKCIRCAVNSKPSVSIVPCPPNANAAQGKKSLLIGSRQAVVAARRACYARTRKDSPTAGDS